MKVADEQSGMQGERVCLEMRIGTHVNEHLAASVYVNFWACRATSAQRSGLWTGFCFRMTTLMYTFCQPRSQGPFYRPLRRSSSISGSHVKAGSSADSVEARHFSWIVDVTRKRRSSRRRVSARSTASALRGCAFETTAGEGM